MNRLILLVESRIRGDVYVRFGGELPKTHRSNTAGRWMLSLPIGKSVNTGTRDAVSYYKNENNLSLPPVYVNAKDLSVIVNQNRWVDSETNTYANGIFIGQMAFSVQGKQTDIDSDGTSKNKIFPLAIWFDESF